MDNEKRGKHRFSKYFYNNITYTGAVLALLILIIEVVLFGLDFFSKNQSTYLGILTYILLPPFLILGLLLIPIGAQRKHKRVQQGLEEGKPKAIYIDLSLATHQNAFIIFMVGTIAVLVMTVIGSYKAFNYTESEEFCGTTCHQIMQPEYVTHSQSPHANVKCVDCHVGSGPGWYVHYKMAGVRMLVKAFDGTYAKPVPAPVETLRPAKETCTECHWPGKSFSSIELKKTYYADDPSQSPPWIVKMLMRTGGQVGESGIHAHMYYGDEIYYVSEDKKRQKITWIKTINKAGGVKIFTTKDSPYKELAPPANKIRRMDCIDCHNRPTHRFEAPDQLINRAITEGSISSVIPMIKVKAVEVLSKEYKSSSEAVEKIRASLMDYYSKKQSQFYQEHQSELEKAIQSIILIYQKNFFPEMKSRWEAYPDNNGHMISLGCFRCHDDEHKAKSGEVISRDCTLCHTITQQGSGNQVQKDPDGMEFKHPFDNDDSWKSTNCSDCHNGGG